MARTGDVDMRWSVVSLNGGHSDDAVEPRDPAHEPPTDQGAAKEALDRITIPQDVLDRIAGTASPRSSLIISDEALSSETGKGTEFVVIMSDEPQGGIKFRRRGPTEAHYRRSHDRLPFWGPSFFGGRYSNW